MNPTQNDPIQNGWLYDKGTDTYFKPYKILHLLEQPDIELVVYPDTEQDNKYFAQIEMVGATFKRFLRKTDFSANLEEAKRNAYILIADEIASAYLQSRKLFEPAEQTKDQSLEYKGVLTQGPHYKTDIHGMAYGQTFAEVEPHFTEMGRVNAARLIACWNACLGIPTETLENFPIRITQWHSTSRLIELELELFKASLKEMVENHNIFTSTTSKDWLTYPSLYTERRNALLKSHAAACGYLFRLKAELFQFASEYKNLKRALEEFEFIAIKKPNQAHAGLMNLILEMSLLLKPKMDKSDMYKIIMLVLDNKYFFSADLYYHEFDDDLRIKDAELEAADVRRHI